MQFSDGIVGVAFLTFGVLVFALWRKAERVRDATLPDVPIEPHAVSPDIDQMIMQLARRSWPLREEAGATLFEFQTMMVANDLSVFLSDLLKHIRSVAPQLNVPRMNPRVVVEGMAVAAGQFVEQDGWVKIAVSANFLTDVEASRAILCHEVCHYVLNASGIRLNETNQNERLTDVAMFVFGLGGVFSAGYRRAANRNYRHGHKLGYLSDPEYAYARKRTLDLWRSGELHTEQFAELQRQFRSTIPDSKVRNRLLEHARSTKRGASEADLIGFILESYRSARR
ncbi:MAG TPA: hypothetical protein VF474_15295 [Phenylobacterium sp.]